jgi:hypothetical protein
MQYELVGVTSKHRPMPSWRFTDAAGHMFRCHDSRGPARYYDPAEDYHVAGTRLIPAGETSLYRLEWVQCGATISPATPRTRNPASSESDRRRLGLGSRRPSRLSREFASPEDADFRASRRFLSASERADGCRLAASREAWPMWSNR